MFLFKYYELYDNDYYNNIIIDLYNNIFVFTIINLK